LPEKTAHLQKETPHLRMKMPHVRRLKNHIFFCHNKTKKAGYSEEKPAKESQAASDYLITS